MNTTCKCTNYQLREVGCDCDANINVGSDELDRRWKNEQTQADAAWNAYRGRTVFCSPLS